MRMMTGAILILAHAVSMAVYEWSDPKPVWMEWYSFFLLGLGGLMLIWGLVLDLSAAKWRWEKRHRHGDR